jgi:hypothetical protein
MKSIGIIVVALALSACVDNTAPVAAGSSPTVSYDFTNGPESPAPLVFRSAGGDFFIFLNDDRASHLVAVMRTPSASADIIPCGGSQNLDPASLQMVFHNSGTINLLISGRDVHVWLYNRHDFLTALNAGGLCNALDTQVPLYQGTSDFVSHDNDAFFSGVHTDSFGFSAHGTVTQISDGKPYSYRNEYHGALAADGSLLHFSSTITLSSLK